MATTTTYKGFIKLVDSNGNTSIVLPITRGELVLDLNRGLAFRSGDFLAVAGTYDKTTKTWSGGENGLMPYLYAQDIENIKRILEEEVGIGGDSGDSLLAQIEALRTLIGNPANDDASPKVPATGLYKYIDDHDKEIKDYVDDHIAANDAMEYKGTVGSLSTLIALPTSGVTNGNTYKVAGELRFNPDGTTGESNKVTAKTGDLIVALVDGSNNVTWTLIPSGDDTLIKADGGSNDPLSGVVILKGDDGITITQNTATGLITISGNGASVTGDLEALEARIKAVEDKIDDSITSEANLVEANKDELVKVEAIIPVKERADNLKSEIDGAVTKGDDSANGVLYTEDDGNSFKNDNKLVKSQAVREIALNLVSHIATAVNVKKIDLGTPLTSAQLAYVGGEIHNYTT